MKKLLFVFLLAIAFNAHAAPPLVYPGEPLAASKFSTVIAEDDACAIVWFYDVGHQWQRTGLYGVGDDCKKLRPEVMTKLTLDLNDIPSWALSAVVGARMLAMTHAEKDALWNAVFNIQPDDPNYAANKATNELADVAAKALFDSVPLPTAVPPSGLVVQATPAFKLRRTINTAPVWVQIGTIALSTPCDTTQKFGPYYRVDRTLVKMASKLADLPDAAYAKCDL